MKNIDPRDFHDMVKSHIVYWSFIPSSAMTLRILAMYGAKIRPPSYILPDNLITRASFKNLKKVRKEESVKNPKLSVKIKNRQGPDIKRFSFKHS